jgi:hypothetical protein
MCAMQALCGTTLPSASGRSAFCVAAGFKDAPNRFCWPDLSFEAAITRTIDTSTWLSAMLT